MKCAKCGREALPGVSTEAMELENGGLLVVRNIPCYQCERCDAVLYTGDVMERLEDLTESAKKLAQEVTVVRYAAARLPESVISVRKAG